MNFRIHFCICFVFPHICHIYSNLPNSNEGQRINFLAQFWNCSPPTHYLFHSFCKERDHECKERRSLAHSIKYKP